MDHVSKLRAAVAAAIAVAAAVPTAAMSQEAGELDCRRVEIMVPYSAGGGTDLYARYLAPLLSQNLPGNPTVIVQNIEGAGGIAGSNQFEERAKADGCTLIAFASSVTSNFVFGDDRVRYQADEWIPILSSPAGTVVYASPSLGVSEPGDVSALQGQQIVMGANNPSGGDMRVLLALDLLDLDVKPIYGINRGDARPGFERGEFNLNFDSSQSYPTQVQPLVDSGKAVPLFSFGIENAQGEIDRDPVVPDLPTLKEVYEQTFGKAPEGPLFDAWRAVFNLNVMASKGIALPSETPDEIVQIYKDAADAIVADLAKPEKQDEVAEIVGPYPQATGEEAARILRSALKFPEETSAFLRDWISQQTDR